MKTVPVIELTHLTEAQKRAYVIADNRLALDAGWDEDLLAEELKALDGLDFNLDLTGFDLDELHDLLEDETAEESLRPSRRTIRSPSPATSGSWATTGSSAATAATRRTRPAARRRADPPGQHRPAVQREGRAASRTTRSPPGSRSFARRQDASPGLRPGTGHPGEGQAHDRKMRAEGPAAGQRLRHRRGVRPAARWPGSATSRACWTPAGRSTSGAATPTAPTTRRC